MTPDEYLDDLLALPRLGASGVSRDGLWVAWTWSGITPTTDVYLARVDGSSAPVRLTKTDENTIFVSWAPDNRSIIVEQDHGGDERVQLFRVDVDRPGVMEPLTEASPSYFLHGGQLHPNGRWLVYSMNYDVETGQEIEPSYVYRHDLQTGERVALARPEKAGYFDPQLNDQGTHILYERTDINPSGRQVWLVDIEGREDREILNFGDDEKMFASWFPDGRRVCFVAETGSYRRVGVWTLDTGEVRWLLDDPDRNVEFAYVPRGLARPVAIIGEIEETRPLMSSIDVETLEETPFPSMAGSLLPRRALDNGEWVGVHYSSIQPYDLVRFHFGDPAPAHSLTGIWNHTSLRPADLTPAEDFRWQSADGLEIQGWLYRTRQPSIGTIVYIHGGPTSHSEDMLIAAIQYYVRRGFNVLSPNYRGSTGFNMTFMESIKEDGWGGREQDDIRDGIQALIAAGIAQPGKVGTTGTSYGGYSSWCAITRFPPELVAASAPICGMTDLVVDYETTRPDLRPYSEEMMGGRPDQVPEKYRERSPINFVNDIRGRLLIVQGMRDPNVSPENVSVVRGALNEAGVEYDILAFEDEGHGIGRPENQRILYKRLAAFFEDAFSRAM